MSYSSSIKTDYIDPDFFQDKKRCVFKLDIGNETVYLSNLRLINLGIILDPANTTSGYIYNPIAGAYVLIKSIQLLAGNEVIEEKREFSSFASFMNYNNSNENNRSLNKWVNKSLLGFELLGGLTGQPLYAPYYPNKNSFQVTDNGTERNLGWLNLRKVFSFLQNVEYLDTKKLNKLRLVIEFETESVYVDKTPSNLTANDSINPPLLCVDVVLNPDNNLTTPNVVEYTPLEVDRVIIPEFSGALTDTGVEQKLKFRMNGFNNKTLNRMLMVNTPTTSNFAGFTKYLSEHQLNQKIQVAVNGRNRLPFDGITKTNQRLRLLNETWGECNTYDGLVSMNGSCVAIYEPPELIGTLDYFSLNIGEKVEDLQVEFTRTCANDSGGVNNENPVNQALELKMYAEVQKVLTFDNNNVLTSYM